MSKINYGLLHCHTEFSVKDSALKVSRLIERAKELGAPAVALTDHGIMTGTYDFMAAAKEQGVKPIPGVEAYFYHAEEVSAAKAKRQHLILMAKDGIGYRSICRAETEGYLYILCPNPHIPFSGDASYPIMDLDILRKYFGAGTEGHGHVIATSACINGPISSILLENEFIQEDMEKLYARRDKYRAVDDEFLDMLKTSEEMKEEIEKLILRRDKITEISKQNLTGLSRRLKTLDSASEEYAELQAELEARTATKEKAKEELEALKRTVANKKREKTEFDKKLKAIQASVEKWEQENEKIEAILAGTSSDEELRDRAEKRCRELAEIFGQGNFYIELQYHGMQTEENVMPILAEIANEQGIPVVAANDIHYATSDTDDVWARTLVAAMRFNQVIDESVTKEEGYGELYIKTDDELKNALMQILDEETVDTAIENIGVIVDQCNVELPYAEHYPKFTGGREGETADERLRRLAEEGIPKRYPGKAWTPEMEERMNYELGVISSQGYSDYLCIVQDFLAYGRSLAKDCPEEVGYTIGPGRGSAVGSIVCYLSGITSVDPIKYNLLFERFLNTERVSMPDIDSDFETSIRGKVIDYVKEKYGEKAVCNIITKGSNAGKGAIRSVGRVTNIPLSVVDEVARKVDNTPNAKIDDSPELARYCMTNKVARELVSDAKLVEGTIVNYGMHAAGVIISDNGDVGEYVPLMYNDDKEQWVAQCDMGQCEFNAGLLKMDFLGLRNLDIITDTLRRIKRNRGISIDIEKVPLEAEVFREIFAAGMTNSVFQFESDGMKSMLKRFKPDSMEDIILLVAAYRPGPMQYLNHIIASKQGKETPVYIAKGLKEILAPTYGYTIYQEQVMQIFNKVAGFSLGEADVVRRAMGKKKINILLDPKTNYHGRFIDGMVKAGATESQAEEFWTQLLDFASYAFNKSHAAAYAFVAYYTAWLKYHYTAEYMCSVMARTDYAKIPMLLNDCKALGIKVKAPDINLSRGDYINVGDTILFGFNNIKGVGSAGTALETEREKNGQFSSMKDVIYRMIPDGDGEKGASIGEGTYKTLIEAGAFDRFCGGNRQSLLNGLGDFIADTKKLKAKKTELAEKQRQFQKDYPVPGSEKDKTYKAALRSVTNCETAVKKLSDAFASKLFLPVPEDVGEKMKREHELLGFYISGNPLDKYRDDIADIANVVPIAELGENGTAIVCGMVESVTKLTRKSDGKQFATLHFFDFSGDIEVKCFTREFEKYSDLIEEGAPLCITARIQQDERMDDAIEKSLSVISMRQIVVRHRDRILICGASILDWTNGLRDQIKAFAVEKDGCECYFCDSFTSETRKVGFMVSQDILNAHIGELLISKI